jgi:hypothetical protein
MTVLASIITSKVTEITNEDYIKLENEKNRELIADFFFNRLHSRYIKPFEYNSDEYREEYKNGFSILANCCLLIETFISFQDKDLVDTKKKSRICFGLFFTKYSRFAIFAKDAFKEGILRTKEEGGRPNDFYDNVRCGILHLGETRNGWKISRKSTAPLFNESTKTINATRFLQCLKLELEDYSKKLIKEKWDSNTWVCFRAKMKAILDNCKE